MKALLLSLTMLTSAAQANDTKIAELAELAGLSAQEVRQELAGLEPNQKILDAIATPWEAKPWHQYRPIFLTQARLDAGLAFWREHADTLARAEAEFQVPAEVIVAIIGVETYFGRHMGVYHVKEALYTLGFHYPPRADFFFKELGQYLRLKGEEGWQHSPKGSYAGAMGMGQFIPSSYRHFALDYDGDGKRDLFASPQDAIGSVANYFHRHGWRLHEPVLARADNPRAVAAEPGLELDSTLGQLKALGLVPGIATDDATPAKLFAFEQAEGSDYQIGFHNFYVITRYNRSPLYARAVWELAQWLKQERADA
ncbi:lytic murein transglycosylase B [Gallaecimonas sp. GXIMD4217]|uniref:lytic murein transglycosylase B n=1 Tax=Gallaecimonas sp. GXIMD4217 TaxID=3131927 RepID=UPI00311B049A